MTYLILNQQIKEGSFLRTQFDIENFRDLFIGKHSYVKELINRISVWQEAKILFTDGPLDSFADLASLLQYRDVNFKKIDPNTDFFYFDLSLFPKDPEFINNLFSKAKYSEDLVLFFQSSQNKEKSYLPIYKVKARNLAENCSSEQVIHTITNQKRSEIELAGAAFLRLDQVTDVLKLFSNNFELRYFNHISSDKDYFIKSSQKTKKIVAEYNFLRHIPSSLKPYFPQVGELKEEIEKASYQIEKVFMFDTSKQLINKVLNKEAIVNKLLSKISDYFANCPTKKVSKEEYQASIHKNFIEKNQKRFEMMRELDVHEKLNQIALMQGYKSAGQVHIEISNAIEEFIKKCKETTLFFSHGDLCFSNILFDANTGAVKLIDPKGFNDDMMEVYLPAYYDLAKLSHSFMGLYDLIIYDLIDVKFTADAELAVEYLLDQEYIELLSSAFAKFVEAQGFDLGAVRLFEASLFMSMIPLHKDGQKKMIAQFMQAIKSFEAYKSLSKSNGIFNFN